MGCICGKASSSAKDRAGGEKKRESIKGSSESVTKRALSSRREESFRVKEKKGKGDARSGLIDKKANGSRRVRDDNFELINKSSEVIFTCSPGCGNVSKATEAELVAAGWPAWFAAVAGEAILGWVPRKADTFEKLDKIGQGTYSSVYKARDLIHNKVVALKRVRFDSADPESVKFMAREILILRRLDHPNIIKLEGLVTSRSSSSLYLVFEYMEHDLTGLASLPGAKFTEPQVKCYMQQLLSGLDHCHSHGVLHRDIKGSNLLIDNQGILKIADFGLATFYDPKQSVPLTSRVVTLWYRPPELLLGATHYGVGIDLWSTGCILGELYAGKPIMPGRTEVEQLHKIFKLCGSPSEDYWKNAKLPHSTVFRPIQPYRRRILESFKDLPAVAVELMDSLLSIDPEHRGTASFALKSDFFTTKPFACDPSSLPKYPPSKEIDAKLREEEHRRQGVGAKDQPKEPRGAPGPDANAEIARSLQRRKENSKTRSEQFMNPHKTAAGFPIDPPRPSRAINEPIKNHSDHFPPIISHSGPLAPGIDWSKSAKRYDDISIGSSRADLSILSRPVFPGDSQDRFAASQLDSSNQMEMPVELLEAAVRRQDPRHYVQKFGASRHGGNGRSKAKEADQGHDSNGNNIHFSGPLLVPSSKVDQLLKDHDRRIQEAARRSRIEKARLDRARAQEMQRKANSIYNSSVGAR
ncbi:PREDICTED: probable serine/threonine-protein kinase At1g54610 isoform X2 [Ipomoea nil]|uniref:probable serine/threonine-protein kinase At1g54610 isoform X2 n=1 Tax=Ipomoea nil TaxID=35883 RepID=UPI000900F94C|nr:PREDICTED: probable serine/threonine-protein kinase At1g54610 isoform X2 [Ipomoea nil]